MKKRILFTAFMLCASCSAVLAFKAMEDMDYLEALIFAIPAVQMLILCNNTK